MGRRTDPEDVFSLEEVGDDVTNNFKYRFIATQNPEYFKPAMFSVDNAFAAPKEE